MPSTPDTSPVDCFSFNGSLSSPTSSHSASSLSLTLPTMPTRSQEAQLPVRSSSPTPLFNRRRSNTTSALLPSPLTVVTSSLANWNGQASASTSSLPIVTLPPYHSTSPPAVTPEPLQTVESFGNDFPQASSNCLSAPAFDMDVDRTPRCSDFPRDVQSLPPSTASMESELQYPEYLTGEVTMSTHEGLELYNVGWEEAQFDMNLGRLSLATPTDEYDFNDFINLIADA